MSVTVRQLTPSLQKLAISELNEDTKRTPSDVEFIKQWLTKQPHLRAVAPSDQMILSFLRGSKFSLEKTKEKIDNFYSLRTLVPELFSQRDPLQPKIQELLSLGIFLPLKQVVSPDSPRLIIMRLGVMDPSKYHISDCVKTACMITEILMLEDDNLMIGGEEIILDHKNVTMSMLGQFTPAFAKKITTCVEKGMLTRQKMLHFINTPTGFDTFYALFRSFLSDKLKNRMQVYSQDIAEMHKNIPKEMLPVEYGGEDGRLIELTDYWKTKVESYRSWFLDQEKQKSDEKLRKGQLKLPKDIFGTEGSFRKIEFD